MPAKLNFPSDKRGTEDLKAEEYKSILEALINLIVWGFFIIRPWRIWSRFI